MDVGRQSAHEWFHRSDCGGEGDIAVSAASQPTRQDSWDRLGSVTRMLPGGFGVRPAHWREQRTRSC